MNGVDRREQMEGTLSLSLSGSANEMEAEEEMFSLPEAATLFIDGLASTRCDDPTGLSPSCDLCSATKS